MNIELDKLEDIFKALLMDLRSEGIDSIYIEDDYYWDIFPEERYNPFVTPSDFGLGQLEDDYQSLIDNQKSDSLVNYDFRNLAIILRYIADKDLIPRPIEPE